MKFTVIFSNICCHELRAGEGENNNELLLRDKTRKVITELGTSFVFILKVSSSKCVIALLRRIASLVCSAASPARSHRHEFRYISYFLALEKKKI